MALTLLSAPIGAGKTEAVQERIIALKQADPFASVWVIRATARQEAAFRERLLLKGGMRAAFNVEFFNFYSLYRRILALAGTPGRSLGEAARAGLIRALLRSMTLEHYTRIRDLPGFARIIGTFLYELKQQRILPENFARAATDARLRDLAAIYSAYQSLLQNRRLIDREGEGWLAVEAVEANSGLLKGIDLLAVDGFDQFNPLQADLLTSMSKQVGAAILTLTDVPDRAATIGRRFARARTLLKEAAGGSIHSEAPVLRPNGVGRSPAIDALTAGFGLPGAAPLPASDDIVFLEAPDPDREAAAVLRSVKRRLLAGAPPDSILIAVRDWGRYGDALLTYARRIGLPCAFQSGEPLAANPAIDALLHVLDLHRLDFRWRDLLDALRSPYFRHDGLDAAAVDALEALCQRALIIDGRDRWLEALRQIAAGPETAPSEAGDDEDRIAPDPRQLTPERAARIGAALARWFERVTPPVSGTTADYVAWIETLIHPDRGELDDADESDASADSSADHFDMPARIRMDDHPAEMRAALADRISRDLSALDALMGVLRGLRATESLLASLSFGGDAALDWDAFYAALVSAVEATTVERAPDRAGRVLITTVSEARGLPHAHVYILGLSEGIFPAPAPADPLLLDSERAGLKKSGIDLPAAADRADDDGLFFELLSLAERTLTLSRPTLKGGEAHLPGPLWKEARRLCPAIPVIVQRIGAPPAPAEVCLPSEAALAAVYSLRRDDRGPETLRVAAWMAAQPDGLWSRIAAAGRVEARRMDRAAPADRYSGVIESAALRDHLAQRFGPDYRWSASALNLFGDCAFRFFAARALRLDEFQAPDAAMDARQRGSILHAILEQTYRRIHEAGLPIAPEQTDAALEQARAAAEAVLASAPAAYHFVAGPTWTHEAAALRAQIERFIAADFSAEGPAGTFAGTRRVQGVELRFGGAGEPGVTVDLPDGTTARFGGSIDRIDRHERDGVAAYRVIDYKSGTTPITHGDLGAGRNFQMAIYLRAAAAALDLPAGDDRLSGVFVSLANRKRLGEIDPTNVKHAQALSDGADHLARYIGMARTARFTAEPVKPDEGRCDRHCPFHHLCRIGVTGKG